MACQTLTAREALQIAAQYGFSIRDGKWERSLIRDSIIQAREAHCPRKSAWQYFHDYMADTAPALARRRCCVHLGCLYMAPAGRPQDRRVLRRINQNHQGEACSMTNNWRPGLPVTRINVGIPVGAYRKPPWWSWALLPVLFPIVWVVMVLIFGWRKRPSRKAAFRR